MSTSGPPPRAAADTPLPRHLDPRRGRVSDAALPPALDPRGPAAGTPRPTGRRPPGSPRSTRRVLGWIALALSVTIFAVATIGYVLFTRYNGQINRIPGLSAALPGLSKPAAAPHDAKNVLLVGSDTRDTTGNQFQGTGAEHTSGQRSDTIILAHLYGGSDQAQLVSFPRDSWVTIPAYTDPKTGARHPQHSAKINSAISEGGPALLIATVERLTDIRVDNYIQIDFAGFQSMVDKLGGVEVCLLHAAKEKDSGINLPAGRQIVRGPQALAFVRQRQGLPNGDLDRIKRQQHFIGSIARKALSSGTLLNPVKLNGFLDAATAAVQVDDDLSGAGLTQLALRLRNFSAGGVQFSTLPISAADGRREGQSVVLLDDAKAATLFRALKRDTQTEDAPAPTTTPTAPALTVAPKAVRVSVYNGSGTSGLGRKVADELAAHGFVVVGNPGNRGTGASTTTVRYGPTRAEAARTLAAAIPGATLQPDPTLGGTLEVVAGSSYAGVVDVASAGSTPAASAPSAAAQPAAPVTAATEGCVE